MSLSPCINTLITIVRQLDWFISADCDLSQLIKITIHNVSGDVKIFTCINNIAALRSPLYPIIFLPLHTTTWLWILNLNLKTRTMVGGETTSTSLTNRPKNTVAKIYGSYRYMLQLLEILSCRWTRNRRIYILKVK